MIEVTPLKLIILAGIISLIMGGVLAFMIFECGTWVKAKLDYKILKRLRS